MSSHPKTPSFSQRHGDLVQFQVVPEVRLNSTASPDVTALGWVSLQKHFSHLPCNLVIYILSVRETINSVMEGLYLSYLCISVPYHKSWPLVVAQQEQAFLMHSFIGSGLALPVIMSKTWVVGSTWDVLCVCCHSVLSSSFATPWTTAHQVPLSVGLPRQGYWSGLPFPPPYLTTNPRVIFSVT